MIHAKKTAYRSLKMIPKITLLTDKSKIYTTILLLTNDILNYINIIQYNVIIVNIQEYFYRFLIITVLA